MTFVRLTNTRKPQLPSTFELGHPEPFVGRARCDDITWMSPYEVQEYIGALSPGSMRRISDGLAAALGLED